MSTVIARAWRAVLPLIVLLGTPWAAGAHDIIYYGRATAVAGEVTVLTAKGSVLLADVGMTCTGERREEHLLNASNPSPLLLQASEVHASTQGIDGVAATRAGVQQLMLELPGLQVGLEQVESFAEARCNSDETVQVNGGSTLSGITVNGQRIAINGQPNQSINIPSVATIVINEQVRFSREFRVVGLHIKLLDPSMPLSGDIRIAAARAKIKVCEM